MLHAAPWASPSQGLIVIFGNCSERVLKLEFPFGIGATVGSVCWCIPTMTISWLVLGPCLVVCAPMVRLVVDHLGHGLSLLWSDQHPIWFLIVLLALVFPLRQLRTLVWMTPSFGAGFFDSFELGFKGNDLFVLFHWCLPNEPILAGLVLVSGEVHESHWRHVFSIFVCLFLVLNVLDKLLV